MKQAPDKDAVYQRVTDKMIEALEAGVVPWEKPWVGGEEGLPRSLATNKPYRGINVFLLGWETVIKGYTSAYWTTYKQAEKLGGNVRKGEKGTLVVYWDFRVIKPKAGEPVPEKPKRVPFLKTFWVFNVEQCENIKLPAYAVPQPVEVVPFDHDIAAAEAILAGMPNPPQIVHGGGTASWTPSLDVINIPLQERFATIEAYWATLFHEITHSTADKGRVGRDLSGYFGSHSYGREELVAQMGSAFLQALCGITNEEERNAAYLGSWIKTIREDVRAVVVAAGAAQKAVDYVLGNTQQVEQEVAA